MDGANGNVSILALAKSLGMSLRALQTRFLATVSLTPKEYAQIQRLQATIRQLDSPVAADAPELELVDAVLAARDERDGDQTLALAAAFVRSHLRK